MRHFKQNLSGLSVWVSCLSGAPIFLHGGSFCLSTAVTGTKKFLALVLLLVKSKTLGKPFVLSQAWFAHWEKKIK